MRTTVDDMDYTIEFQYVKDTESWGRSFRVKDGHGFMYPIQPNMTICRVLTGPKGSHCKEMKEIASGIAVRSHTDAFVKEKGRVHSFARALDHKDVLSKDVRRALGNMYFGRFPKKSK